MNSHRTLEAISIIGRHEWLTGRPGVLIKQIRVYMLKAAREARQEFREHIPKAERSNHTCYREFPEKTLLKSLTRLEEEGFLLYDETTELYSLAKKGWAVLKILGNDTPVSCASFVKDYKEWMTVRVLFLEGRAMTVREMEALAGISDNNVREGLKALRAKGIILKNGKHYSYVGNGDPDPLPYSTDFPPKAHQEDEEGEAPETVDDPEPSSALGVHEVVNGNGNGNGNGAKPTSDLSGASIHIDDAQKFHDLVSHSVWVLVQTKLLPRIENVEQSFKDLKALVNKAIENSEDSLRLEDIKALLNGMDLGPA